MISVVVPLYDEEENVRPLVEAVRAALRGERWELVLVDDGSRDGTAATAARAARGDHRIRLVCLARNYGQTTATQAGFDHARGEVVVTMDGDLQNDPADIPRLVERLREGYDMVAGYRERRQDRLLTRTIPSRVANGIIRRITGIPVRDNGCSLKAYRREVLRRTHLYSDMHRFIPALVAGVAGARITELPVRHHPRRHGESKYGLSRVWKVSADLLTVKMVRSFRDRPLALFGTGTLLALGAAWLFAAAWVLALAAAPAAQASALVYPGAALLCAGLAAFLLMLGMIAEVALREHVAGGTAEELPLVREAAGGRGG